MVGSPSELTPPALLGRGVFLDGVGVFSGWWSRPGVFLDVAPSRITPTRVFVGCYGLRLLGFFEMSHLVPSHARPTVVCTRNLPPLAFQGARRCGVTVIMSHCELAGWATSHSKEIHKS